MCKISNRVYFPRVAAGKLRMSIKPLAGLLVLALLMALAPAQAQEADDDYLQVLYTARQADELAASGKVAPAKAKYQEALTALIAFQKAHPDWNAGLIASRAKGLTEKVAAMTEKLAAQAAGAGTNAAAPAPGGAATAKFVKLLEAGAEPRKALRLHPAPDDKQTLTLSLKMGKSMNAKLTLDSTVKQVADDGSITYTLVLSDLSVGDMPGVAPAAAEGIKAALAAIKGMSGTGTVSSQGVSGELKVQAATSSNPMLSQFGGQMQELFAQFAIELPEQAVGAGAKWEVKRPMKSQGMTVDLTASYELVALEDDRLTIKGTRLETAANQTIQNPAMPGIKVTVNKMTGKDTLDYTVDLTHLLPVAGSSKSHIETSMTTTVGGQNQTGAQKQDVDIQFEAK
jgi:hypothetical protein